MEQCDPCIQVGPCNAQGRLGSAVLGSELSLVRVHPQGPGAQILDKLRPNGFLYRLLGPGYYLGTRTLLRSGLRVWSLACGG